MKLSADLEAAFNEQITLEFESSIAYRQLAVEMDVRDLPGMAAWLRIQADEEIVHAHKFIDHLVDRDNHARIGAIAAPATDIDSVPACFQAALAHEEKVSEAIRELYRRTESAGDLDSRPLLNWFVDEQIEEESTVREILGRLALIGDDGLGLLKLDEELGARGAV